MQREFTVFLSPRKSRAFTHLCLCYIFAVPSFRHLYSPISCAIPRHVAGKRKPVLPNFCWREQIEQIFYTHPLIFFDFFQTTVLKNPKFIQLIKPT